MKRIFDFTLAAFLLFLFAIPLVLIYLLVRYNLGSPAIFKQPRPGLEGRLFNMYKFRTMTDKRDVRGQLLDDASRLTKFGQILRASSLDELPELWNVLKGDMSLVGPRPLLPEYIELYTAEQNRRHEVRPGITGWAQVNGRNAISWEQKFALDVWYVDNRNFLLDLKILFLTVYKVFKRSNISAENEATMTRFNGSHRS